jgi:hypothetical protein
MWKHQIEVGLIFCLLYAVANGAIQPGSGVTFRQTRGVFYVGDSGDLRTKYFYSTSMALRRILWSWFPQEELNKRHLLLV